MPQLIPDVYRKAKILSIPLLQSRIYQDIRNRDLNTPSKMCISRFRQWRWQPRRRRPSLPSQRRPAWSGRRFCRGHDDPGWLVAFHRWGPSLPAWVPQEPERVSAIRSIQAKGMGCKMWPPLTDGRYRYNKFKYKSKTWRAFLATPPAPAAQCEGLKYAS